VADSGDSFNVQKTKAEIGPYQGNEQIELLREGGLGLYLIESLMDEVIIHHKEGVAVFMTKYLEGEQVETNGKTAST
jgi:serine/threonine-protein kinase RsbW